MKSRPFYLAVCVTLVSSSVSYSNDDGEEEDADIPVVGKIAVSGAYNMYSHGSQGWTEADKIGIYMLSDDKAQDNLPYAPSEVAVATTTELDGKTYIVYDRDSHMTEDITLNPSSELAVGFRGSDHTIYAYTPYNAASQDYKAVTLPNLTMQEYYESRFMPHRNYSLAYASAIIPSCSAAIASLGEFKPLFSQITLPDAECSDSFVGKKFTKAVVSCDHPIACEDGATVDLSIDKISGTPINSITYNLPNGGFEITAGYSGASLETYYMMIAVPPEARLAYTYNLTLTVDGQGYTISGRSNEKMSSVNNLNMYGIAGIE